MCRSQLVAVGVCLPTTSDHHPPLTQTCSIPCGVPHLSVCSYFIHLQVLVLPQFSRVSDFCFSYFIRNVFAVRFSTWSPLCAVFGPAPDALHLPKSKRRHSCLCLCISSLSYLTQTEEYNCTYPLPQAKGHYVLYETWKSITPLKDLQTIYFLGRILSWSNPFFPPWFLISLFSIISMHGSLL